MSNSVLPRPGEITNPEGIPQSIRDIPQWIIWKPVLRGKKVTKVPCLINGEPINAHDRTQWQTFSDAVAAMQGDTQGRFGIGFVLDGTGLLCVDYDDHAGDDATAVREGAEAVSELLAKTPTYAERSLQGNGQHIFYRATLPHGRTSGTIEKFNIEIYARQFIAMTGNAIGWPQPVADGQALVDSWNLPPPATTIATVEPTLALGRTIGLSDGQVVGTLRARRPQTFDLINSPLDFADRSEAFMKIIGDLDKITGEPAQVDAIIRKSPCFQNGHNRERYERYGKWLAKQGCESMLEYWLKDARGKNTDCIAPYEHLTPERVAFLKSLFLPRPPTSDESIVELSDAPNTLNGVVKNLLQGTPIDAEECDALRHLIDLNYRGMKKPFRPFAEIATVASFGALFSRKFKSTDGLSTAAMEMLIAPTGSGKGEAFNFWPTHISRRADPNNPSKVMTSGASSAEALHGQVQALGTTLWVRQDATADIKMLAEPRDANQTRFRDYTYEIFDASRDHQPQTMPPASIASQKRNDRPIHNACCSLLWSTTPASFTMVYNMTVLASGLGSRVLVSVHDKHSGNLVHDSQVSKELDARANGILNKTMLAANEIDEAYRRDADSGDALIVRIGYTQEASDFIWQVEQAQSDTHQRVDGKELPPHYAVFLRTAMLAKKLALLSALVRHFDMPQVPALIIKSDVQWALARVVRSMASLAHMFDSGDLGEGGDAERRAALRTWVIAFFDTKNPPRDKRIKSDMLENKIMPYWWLMQRAERNKAFKDYPLGTDRALQSTLMNLVAAGAMQEVGNNSAKRFQIIDADLL